MDGSYFTLVEECPLLAVESTEYLHKLQAVLERVGDRIAENVAGDGEKAYFHAGVVLIAAWSRRATPF